MDSKLTLRAALEKILTENKNILNDPRAMDEALKNLVSSECFMELDILSMALWRGKIGEFLMTADGAVEEVREQKKADAIAKLKTLHINGEIAVSVVEMLTEAMGWNRDRVESKETAERLIIPVINTDLSSSQRDIQELTQESEAKTIESSQEADVEEVKTSSNELNKDGENDKSFVLETEKILNDTKEEETPYNQDTDAVCEEKKQTILPQKHSLKDKFFSSKGRLNRKRYILRSMVVGAIQGTVQAIDKLYDKYNLQLGENLETILALILLMVLISSVFSHFTLIIRRLHDTNRSGWWSLLFAFYYISTLDPEMAVIMIVGWPLAIYLIFAKGTTGFNRFGPDPLGETDNNVANFIHHEIQNNDVNGKQDTGTIKKIIATLNEMSTAKKIISVFFAGVIAVFLCLFALVYLDRESAREHNAKGLAYTKEKEYDKAVEEYNEAIKLYPNYAEAYFNRGIAHYEDIEYDEALNDFNRTIEIEPKYAEAFFYRGLMYCEDIEYDKALDDFNQAVKLKPSYAEAYFNRGLIYLEDKKDYDKARNDFDKAIDLNSNYAEAFFNRGMVYRNKNQNDKALTDFNQAIRLKSNYAEAYFNRAMLYDNEMNQYDKAMEDYTKAIALAPKRYDKAYNNRGVLQYNKGNYYQAIADFQEALAINSNNKTAKENLQVALQKVH